MLQHFHLYQSSAISSLHLTDFLYGSEIWALAWALEARITAFDNICLRRILWIQYTDHVSNADVQIWAGSPPHLLSLIQTRRLCFFRRVARMSDMQNTFRALHTSICELYKDWKRRPGRLHHTWLLTIELTSNHSTMVWIQHWGLQKIEDDGGSSWRQSRSSLGHAHDDDDDFS